MPGLLDITDDPQQLGLLSLGLRLMSTPGKFGTALGQAGMGALGDVQQARQMMEQRKLREQQARMQGLQMQSLEQQLADAQRAREEAQRQAERDETFRRSIPSPQGQALQTLGADASPTMANAARLPQVDPRSQLLYDALRNNQMKTADYLAATQKDRTPIKLGKDDRLLDPITNRVLVDAMPDPGKDTAPSDWKLYQLSGAPQRGLSFDQWDLTRRRANATSVTVQPDNLGLKPKDKFEMEQKLGADFTNATKTDRGIVSVSADLTNILKQPGAIKDQAAIYKFAKFLDQEGAVREADYAAIVNTAGGIDKVRSLFNRAMTGEQLSPTQRTEMDNLVRSMAAVAQGRIDGARKRFGANARMYNLNPDNVFQAGDDTLPSLQDLAAAELARRQGRK